MPSLKNFFSTKPIFMKIATSFSLLFCFFFSVLAAQNFPNTIVHGPLKVSPNQRYLVHADGTPFYWLGDTAWELFHRLKREEADTYLKNRFDKGYTVIQAVVLAEIDGLGDPNPYGEIPLENNDPTKPREAYFKHVDYIVDKAAELGLYIAMLPTWGDKLFKDRWGKGPEIFNTSNAKTYGEWIGNRYKDRKNIIWVLGGDRNPRDQNDIEVWRAMAAGIETAVGGADKALMTYHPQPNDFADGGAGKWFHNDAWFDFNMFQTGHCRENNVYDRIQVSYKRTPIKPCIDGESIYENHPVCFNSKDLGISSAYDVRKYAWLDVFAGAFGNTYGCHDIWQMYGGGRAPVNGANIPWDKAIELPAAGQMQHLRRLIESRPMLERVPNQALIVSARNANDRIQATSGKNYAFIYSAQGKEISVKLGLIAGTKVKATWYNPRDGKSTDAGEAANKGIKVYKAPTSGYGQDWCLVLDFVK
jgi:hypothetical protein